MGFFKNHCIELEELGYSQSDIQNMSLNESLEIAGYNLETLKQTERPIKKVISQTIKPMLILKVTCFLLFHIIGLFACALMVSIMLYGKGL